MKNKNIILGIDIGGTKMLFACVEQEKIIGDILSYKTPDSLEELLSLIYLNIEKFLEQYPIKAAAIATAGTVDLENSKVTGSTGNLPKGYDRINLKEILEEKFKIPLFIENDANAAAFAEFKAGNAKGHLNTITLTLGTGIGGGIIVEGKLLKGKTGAAAEVGHIPITRDKNRKCTCGNWGCWEAYASGTGYAINARQMAMEISAEKKTGILKNKIISELSTYDIIEGLKYNDTFAIKVHDLWEEYLSDGLVALTNIFEPESILMSGGMAKFINYENLNAKVSERILVSQTSLIPAKFDNLAGILGAAYLVSEK